MKRKKNLFEHLSGSNPISNDDRSLTITETYFHFFLSHTTLTSESTVMQHRHRIVAKNSAIGNIHHERLALDDAESRVEDSESLNLFRVERARLEQREVRVLDDDVLNVTVVDGSRGRVELKGRGKQFEVVDGQFFESLRIYLSDLRVVDSDRADLTEQARQSKHVNLPDV